MKTILSSVSLSMLLLLVISGTGLAQWNWEIVAWGWNGYGQCDVPAPNSDFVAVAAGSITQPWPEGRRLHRGMGIQQHGQCNVPAPTAVSWRCAGGNHSLGLKADGSIVAWGKTKTGSAMFLPQ